MSETTERVNGGILFKENSKKSENYPDFTGRINVEGIDYRLAAWIKEAKTGNKFLSLKVTTNKAFEDEIPF